jgi:hypothetical protein
VDGLVRFLCSKFISYQHCETLSQFRKKFSCFFTIIFVKAGTRMSEQFRLKKNLLPNDINEDYCLAPLQSEEKPPDRGQTLRRSSEKVRTFGRFTRSNAALSLRRQPDQGELLCYLLGPDYFLTCEGFCTVFNVQC